MDPLIRNLKSTTFFGQRLTRQQIVRIQQTVGQLPQLSRTELGHTLCVQFGWQTPTGSNRVQFAQRLLEELERIGILTLPQRKGPGRGPQKPLELTARTAPQPVLEEPLAGLRPLQLRLAGGPAEVAEWNEWVERYHPLGYRQPVGAHLRYFLLDRAGRKLGCLGFDFAASRLACRDAWIGWPEQARQKRIKLVVRNQRYLLFPWVRVAHLASHALGLAARQLARDWQQRHGYRPVLLETYTDPQRHRGTCYRAAGWQQLGSTQGRGPGSGPKQVWVRPLQADWRAILRQGAPAPARRGRARPLPQAGDGFVQLWQELIATAVQVAREHDAQWVRRQRALNTLLVMLFVFRLAFAPERRGYATVLSDLWENCRQLGVDLPQPRPVSAAAICKARPKVDAAVFRRLHRELLQHLPQGGPGRLWQGHRTFAVDGSKLNLPRPLRQLGYAPPGPGAHYPQGLLSCLFQLYAQLPVDFQLHAHGDERRASLEHLAALRPGDVVVYDRGYYSFGLLAAHCQRGLHAVFRLKSDANAVFAAFIANSERDDEILTLAPSARARQQDPQLRPCRVRLLKYTAGPTSFALATTLLEPRYRRQDLAALYHGRWSIEELFKVSKDMLKVAPFHGQSERLVKQEVYAHFTLIALTRVFADEAEQGFRAAPDGHGRPAVLANFRHSLHCVARQLEGLFLQQASVLGETVQRILDGVAACRQRRRPGRSYERRSRQPANKWRKRTTDPTASQA